MPVGNSRCGYMDPVACMPVGSHVRQRVAPLGLVFFIRVLQYLSVKSQVNGVCSLLEAQRRTPQAQGMHTLHFGSGGKRRCLLS